jgi:hypothetical protein
MDGITQDSWGVPMVIVSERSRTCVDWKLLRVSNSQGSSSLSGDAHMERVASRSHSNQASSYQDVETAHCTQAQYHAAPKCSIVEDPATTNEWTPLQGNDR